ncbi:hypothetical protein ACFQGE_11600 [Halomicroarcula sp. GCM10025817]|uniref:hypothetical protein n=1 Tax=Haloarcula TaxID=2237 RepID=UPI0023E89DCC|nr:hypothetical protein [Halomicroarcula sp. SYNS111]
MGRNEAPSSENLELLSNRPVRWAVVGLVIGALAVVIQPFATLTLGPVSVTPLPMAFGLTSVLGGPLAVVACAVGYIATEATNSIVPVWSAVGYASLGLLVSVCWTQLNDNTRVVPDVRSRSAAGKWITASAVAALGSSTLLAWGYVIMGQFSFYPTALFTVLSYTVSLLVGGGAVVAGLPRIVGADRWQSLARRECENVRAQPGTGWIGLVTAILFGWFILASSISIGFQIVELVPPFHIRARDLEPLLLFTERGPFDDGGQVFQLAVGATAIALLVAVVRRYNVLDWTRS